MENGSQMWSKFHACQSRIPGKGDREEESDRMT